ncbi:MAG TPA: hypothetical protein VEZ55_06945 [Chitinophagaceae bacterium]|nr:hypothetical protein [Chitinophagaceae bacterium]
MAVSLKPKFKKADIERIVLERMMRIESAVLMRLQRVGENFITNARNLGEYTDQTGNLRSSKGYVVLRNGVQYANGGFEQVKGGSAGKIAGNAALSEAMQKFPTGLVLICVAGMDYAAAVEAKGKDVLTGSSLIATQELKKALKEISRKIETMR